MGEDIPLIENAQALEDRLGKILVKGSLYRTFVYTGKSAHFSSGERKRFGLLPHQLKMFCGDEQCKGETWWECDYKSVYFGSDFICKRYYACRNCGSRKQYYQFIWQENEKANIFIKVGQWPPLEIEPSKELSKSLGPEDSNLYKKGLINYQFGHGIAAVAYFRRVLENKVNALLALIVEAARNENMDHERLQEIETVKDSHRVEDKIDVATKILPAHLKPGGHNPLDKLYAPLSAGLHGESDDACLRIFSDARFVFEYLFKNLTESNEEARKYVQRLSAPPKGNKP
jgi:hypothetical protein